MGLLDKLFNREIKDISEQEPVLENNVDHSGEKFHMVIDDVFTITGRGTVVTGVIESGVVRTGDTVSINGSVNSRVLGIEMFRKTLDFAQAGDACGLRLENIARDDVHKGDYLTK